MSADDPETLRFDDVFDLVVAVLFGRITAAEGKRLSRERFSQKYGRTTPPAQTEGSE